MTPEELLSIVREFMADVDAVGVDYVKEEWPDLHVTYMRAADLLKVQP